MRHFLTICVFALMSSGQAQLPSYVPTQDLVAWYPMDNSGDDFSGNGFHGEVIGSTFTHDRFGSELSSAYFDWSAVEGYGNPWHRIEINPGFDGSLNGTFTVAAWIKPEHYYWPQNSAHSAMIFGYASRCPNTAGLRFSIEGEGALRLRWGNNAISDEGAVVLNEWQHVVGTIAQDSMRVYINGIQVGSAPAVEGPTSGCFNIGELHQANGHWYYFDGAIDDLGVWDHALSESEISALYNSEAIILSCTDPAACNYDEGAEEDDGSCAYPAYGEDCNGDCAGGTAWYVDGNASEPEATGESVSPFTTIQAASDVACEGDTIFVAPGVYPENVSLTQSHVVLTGYAYSEVSEPIAEQVIIDGGELGTTLFVSGEYNDLAHLTIQNGRSGYGAGLYLDGSHHSWIHDCVIRDNVGTGDITAHGIQLGASHCVIEDCLVTGNYGRKHTINAGGSDNVIRNCRIVDNTAWETGGGIVAYTDRMLIENCLIANNEGGGITTYNDNTVVDHCTVTGNGGFGFFIWCLDDADMYVSNTVASGNGSTEVKIQQTGNQVGTFHVRNSLIEGGVNYDWTSVYKVIDSDASLLELSPNLTGDFTLSSISPAIGHGTDFRYDFDGLLEGEGSVEDLSGDARPQPSGTMPDLGCFEHPLGMPEPTFGCTDSSACNYEASVTDDDGSCIFPTCDDITACNYDADAVCGGGVCIPSGCLEPEACNFNPNAECEGETCDYTCCPGPGCCDLPAVWDSAAQMCVVVESICGEGTAWDESLQQCLPEDMCFADLDNDGAVGMADLLDLLTQFGSECAE